MSEALTFDYVVVGAGSAGCVIANRLSESGKYSVALIEAGGKDSSPWIHIPVGYFRTMGNPNTDWCYKTEPDPGLNGRAINWPRGKTLGGSSSINGLLYVRGQPEDYDHWRQLGNVGWAWDDVAPLFRRAETWEEGADELRGGDGPLNVSNSRLKREIIDAWIEAAENAGYPRNPDYNGASQEGVGYFQLTARKGMRCSTAVAYLRPAMRRNNLEVMTGFQTEKVLFDGLRATGIEAKRSDGSVQRVEARREIILSAGAIGSPQILMLSGLGDGEALGGHGVQSVRHLPGMGRNLQDHLQARPVYKCTASTINTELRSLLSKAKMALEYAAFRTGPMTMAASLGAGFVKSKLSPDTPDIQFHIQPWSADSPAEGPHKFSAFTASVLQLRPRSTGHLELRSASFDDAPAIYPNYLSDPLDCATLVEGLRITRQIARHAPLSDLITEEHGPGAHIADADDDALLDWARSTATTIYHPTGTCKMGPDSDNMAVVDSRLRVHGIEGLRVADCSIMPMIVSGNTNAPAIMIGEKASDMILEDAQ